MNLIRKVPYASISSLSATKRTLPHWNSCWSQIQWSVRSQIFDWQFKFHQNNLVDYQVNLIDCIGWCGFILSEMLFLKEYLHFWRLLEALWAPSLFFHYPSQTNYIEIIIYNILNQKLNSKIIWFNLIPTIGGSNFISI